MYLGHSYCFEWRDRDKPQLSGWSYTGRQPIEERTAPNLQPSLLAVELRVGRDDTGWYVVAGDCVQSGFTEGGALGLALYRAAELHGFPPTGAP